MAGLMVSPVNLPEQELEGVGLPEILHEQQSEVPGLRRRNHLRPAPEVPLLKSETGVITNRSLSL